jgi:hypothetical protein
MSLRSDLVNLAELTEQKLTFCVPIYQRLYVWDHEQVRTLIDDLWSAFEGRRSLFYLGGALVVEREGEADAFDLIDGQQRFTTLWMMSLVWQGSLRAFAEHSKHGKIMPRLTFPIRAEVDAFFLDRLRGERKSLPGNPLMENALAHIETFKTQKQDHPNWSDFVEFVFRQVQLVLTHVPAETDLNKLFEVINNRGVQLQHHEILKARLLGRLPAPLRHHYACLWDACAEMGNYVEKNLRDITKLRIADLYIREQSEEGSAANGREDLGKATKVLRALKQQESESTAAPPLSLTEILNAHSDFTLKEESRGEEMEICESDAVRSIISFPMLLQHTLRIWLQRAGRSDLPKILDKELLEIFTVHFCTDDLQPEEVEDFIGLLWEIRYCFDRHIIKWVMNDEEEQHLICRLYRTPKKSDRLIYTSLQRRKPDVNEGFALLQSMLYHSQQITTHYWLTPLLAFLHNEKPDDAQAYAYLRHLDNQLLGSEDADNRPLIERTREFIDTPWKKNKPRDLQTYLREPFGTGFPHYWFYKLEFELWAAKGFDLTPDQRASFRMTAKNSVEHISPQLPQKVDKQKVSKKLLDCFGNLALVSRSINSEFSNKPFTEKRAQFLNRNNQCVDSLKMAVIYQNAVWNDELAEEHQDYMIALLVRHQKIDHAKG